VTPKKLVFLGVLGLADCTPSREPRSVAASLVSTNRRWCVAVELDVVDSQQLGISLLASPGSSRPRCRLCTGCISPGSSQCQGIRDQIRYSLKCNHRLCLGGYQLTGIGVLA